MQIQTELDFPSRVLLQPIEHSTVGVLFPFHIEREITRDLVGADGLLQVREKRPIRILLLKLLGPFDDVAEGGVFLDAFFPKDLDDAHSGRRIDLKGGPGDNEDDD